MFKKKIVYFPDDGSNPRIYVNPSNEASIMRTGRAVVLNEKKQKELSKIPVHHWKLNQETMEIEVDDVLAEVRCLELHGKRPKSLQTWEWFAIFSMISVLSGIIGYFIGAFL